MTAADSSSHCIVSQEVLPHQPEAVAVQGQAVQTSEVGPEIGLDEIAASLRLEHGPVAAALLKARDALQKQQQAQQQRQQEEAAAATAQSRSAAQKPKVSQDCILLLAVQMSQAVLCGCLVNGCSRHADCAVSGYCSINEDVAVLVWVLVNTRLG